MITALVNVAMVMGAIAIPIFALIWWLEGIKTKENEKP
jgi:hypothetical protein